MKKLAISSLLLGSLVGLGLNVSAEDNSQTIVGENEATIEVNGTLGADNTKPDAPINEGDNDWINVSVPTKTVFYGVAKTAEAPVKSPEYTITNNSGRPVEVSVSKFSLNGEDNFKETNLNLQLKPSVEKSVDLIKAGVIDVSETVIGNLANTEGKLTKEGDDGQPKAMTFSYTGSYDGTKLDASTSTTYNLVLKFKAVSFN